MPAGKHSDHAVEPRPLGPEGEALLEALARHPLADRVTERRLLRIVDVVSRRLSSVTVVLENLNDPHNVAAVVRTAEGFGIGALHLVEQLSPARLNRAITRGADHWVTLHRYKQLDACVAALKEAGFRVAAADVGKGCVLLSEVPVDGSVALVFGSEHDGLTQRAKALADVRFTIPMAGFTGSFNVSVSAAVALYDVTRRRRERLGREGDLSHNEQRTRAMLWLERSARREAQSRGEMPRPRP